MGKQKMNQQKARMIITNNLLFNERSIWAGWPRLLGITNHACGCINKL
jgi:hypothetical protein